MKRFLVMLCAIIPLGTALVVLQSCGGQGGPTITGTNGGGVTRAFLALLPVSQASATYVGTARCATCHNDPANPHFTDWQTTKHAAKNVGCEQCHGAGSIHAEGCGSKPIRG